MRCVLILFVTCFACFSHHLYQPPWPDYLQKAQKWGRQSGCRRTFSLSWNIGSDSPLSFSGFFLEATDKLVDDCALPRRMDQTKMMCSTSTGNCHQDCAVAVDGILQWNRSILNACMNEQTVYNSLHFTFWKDFAFFSRFHPMALNKNQTTKDNDLGAYYNRLRRHYMNPQVPNCKW